ncbi:MULTISPECIES: chloride channel protein [Corynebacterium]|uniref:chloride channel protein n=1 Tax=Corynebacterium TaxID=1716 RepID=UPI001CEFA8A4|nr:MULTISPECIES: chloride channel protein [Corynebacterium]
MSSTQRPAEDSEAASEDTTAANCSTSSSGATNTVQLASSDRAPADSGDTGERGHKGTGAATPQARLKRLALLCIYTLIVGVGTGLGAAALVKTMQMVEMLVYSRHEGMTAHLTAGTTAAQRFWGITIAGLLAGVAYYLLQTKGKPIRSVTEGMKGKPMPVLSTFINAFLQMITVAAGASVGRENAPRELGAMMSSQLSHRLELDSETRRILVAAAAGAGLGAIYHIPLAGAIFAVEILLGSITIRAMMTVLACSAVATVTSGIVVGNDPLYATIPLSEGWGNLGAAIIVGALCGLLGVVFRSAISRAESNKTHGAAMLWTIPAAFILVGLMSIYLPTVLGNGRLAATEVLVGRPALAFAAALLVAKGIAVFVTLRSGAVGGVLTPGFAIGALAGYCIGVFLQPFMPGLPASDFALLGCASFLSTSMAAPLFAVIVTIEFTGQTSSAYLALFLAAATASLAGRAASETMKIPLNVTMPWNRP